MIVFAPLQPQQDKYHLGDNTAKLSLKVPAKSMVNCALQRRLVESEEISHRQYGIEWVIAKMSVFFAEPYRLGPKGVKIFNISVAPSRLFILLVAIQISIQNHNLVMVVPNTGVQLFTQRQFEQISCMPINSGQRLNKFCTRIRWQLLAPLKRNNAPNNRPDIQYSLRR